MKTTEFKEDVIREAFERFFGSRIVFICAAGSIVHNRATPTSDLDLMLVLDTYLPNDIKLCRQVVQVLNDYYYLVGISLQYADELPIKPEDVQDGSKSSLALAYINSAYVIAGENIYKELFRQLPKKAFQRSIIRTLEEYLHRMYALAFNYTDDNEEFKAEAFKFLTRSIIDAMLYYNPSDMAPYDKFTKQQVLDRYKNSPEIRHITAGISVNSSPTEMVQAMRAIIIQLKKDYGIL
jgi:predicted nucleotidyltransferase